MKKYLLLALTGTLIVGCRPYDDGDDAAGAASGSEVPEIGAALAGQQSEAAVGSSFIAVSSAAHTAQQSESAIGTLFVGITDEELEELGALTAVPVTETRNIESSKDFNFSTSRAVSVSLDVVEARGMTTDVVFCTDYLAEQGSYDVNYDSCLFQAEMHDGRLTTEIEVVNQFDKVLGAVWFPEKGTEPVYREFWVE